MGKFGSADKGGWSRRQFLQRAAAGAVAAPLAACGNSTLVSGLAPPPASVSPENPFKHGVASGDPLPDRVILWTRATPPPEGMTGDIPVDLTVAEDPALSVNVRTLAVTAVAARDWTVKPDAEGLEPGRTYYYRFRALGHDSPIGRARTADLNPSRRPLRALHVRGGAKPCFAKTRLRPCRATCRAQPHASPACPVKYRG